VLLAFLLFSCVVANVELDESVPACSSVACDVCLCNGVDGGLIFFVLFFLLGLEFAVDSVGDGVGCCDDVCYTTGPSRA
jgi:hypothetical protein